MRSTRSGVGSARTWRVTVTSLGARQIGEGAVRREIGDRLRLGPGQRAAERALAVAQAHRQQLVVVAGGGEPRAGEADQRAAVLDPVDKLFARGVRDGADIGHDDHRRLLLEDLRDGVGEVRARRLDQIGEGLQRAA